MMNRIRILLVIMASFVFFIISEPIYSKADLKKSMGNVFGIEENIIQMKEDLIFLDTEIDKLRQECEP